MMPYRCTGYVPSRSIAARWLSTLKANVLRLLLVSLCFPGTPFLLLAPAERQVLARSSLLLDGGNPYHYTLSELQASLPQPVLEQHSAWVDMYWGAWQILTAHILSGTPQNGFVAYYMDPAFNGDIFLWDTVFMTMFARYGASMFPVMASLDNFYLKQQANGFIARQFKGTNGEPYEGPDNPNSINPPLLSWGEWEYYEVTGDKSRFKMVLPRLVKSYDWIKAHRTNENGLYWNTGLGSGMDNSPQHSVCDTCFEEGQDWIDMSSQQALNALMISRIAGMTGEARTEQRFQEEYRALKQLINTHMWSSQDGTYYPVKYGRFVPVKTLGNFWPLLAQIADEQQAAQLVKHLLNPNEFYREHPFPSLAASDPRFNSATGNYWRGGVWAPTNYMVLRGLDLYGNEEIAHQAAMRDIQNVARVYQKTGTLWENYAPDSASQGSPARPRFVGWSGNFAITELIENVLGFQVDAPNQTLTWRLALTEHNGIKRLHIGANTISLIAEPRASDDERPHITVQAEQPFTLKLDLPRLGTFTQVFQAGDWRWTPGTQPQNM